MGQQFGLVAWRVLGHIRSGRALAIGVGIVLAALPQDILYVIDSDVLCPLAMALLLYLSMRWIEDERRSMIGSLAVGLTAAAAVLVKYTNMAALAVVRVAVWLGRRRRSRREVIALVAATVAPVGIWLLRCQWEFGDWTAAKDKKTQVKRTHLRDFIAVAASSDIPPSGDAGVSARPLRYVLARGAFLE